MYKYEYDLKDHLGDTRVTTTWNSSDATQMTPYNVGKNDYYAFGYVIQSTQYNIAPKNEYLYNHKELQEETGLYDYGARFYDPVSGRWTTPDPSSDDQGQEIDSPYGYVADNPTVRNDPDGKIWNYIVGAVIGAAVDYGTHAAANYYANSKLPENQRINPWTQNINLVSIGTSAATGALTSGASAFEGSVAKLGLKVVTTVVNNVAEVKTTKDGLTATFKSNVVNIAKNTAIDLAADGLTSTGGKVAGAIVNKIGDNTIQKAANKVLTSRNSVSNALKSTGLSSAIGRDIRNGQRVLAKQIVTAVKTAYSSRLNAKISSTTSAIKDKTDVKQ